MQGRGERCANLTIAILLLPALQGVGGLHVWLWTNVNNNTNLLEETENKGFHAFFSSEGLFPVQDNIKTSAEMPQNKQQHHK